MRLDGYDYSQDGFYFVTICTLVHSMWFGNVHNNNMILSTIGKIVDQCWVQIPQHFTDVKLDEYVIMPNHVHGIIAINQITRRMGTACRAPISEKFGKPISGSIPTIIRSFKSAVTKKINEYQNTPTKFIWQRNYYDHIIRNDNDLIRTREYVRNNPLKWRYDCNHLDNRN